MIPNQYRPARAGDLYVGRRVFCFYVGSPTTPTADSLGTVIELSNDGWHRVRVDSGRLYSFNYERLAVLVDEPQNDHYRPAQAGDLSESRRVFIHDLQGGPSLGTITDHDGSRIWQVVPDAGAHAGEPVGKELGQMSVTDFVAVELAEYHTAALAHLETVHPRPMHKMTERDAEAYHAYGDTPAEAAEMWAESTLYELDHNDQWPALQSPELFHLPERIDAAGPWQQDAQHGPYVAESTPDGTVARVVHIPSPYSTERRTVEVFLCDDAWQQAMATAWRHYRNERPTYAGR